MNKDETSRVVAMVMKSYSRHYKEMPMNDIEFNINLWQEIFADDDYPEVIQALKSFISDDTKGFPPVPGQLKQYIADKAMRGTLSELEAWELVRNAISRGLYHAKEEYDKLPDMVRNAVGGSGNINAWARLDSYIVDSEIQRNFIQAYRQEVKRKTFLVKLPAEARKEYLPEGKAYQIEKQI